MPPKGDDKKDAGAKEGKGLASSSDIFVFIGAFLIVGALITGVLSSFSESGSWRVIFDDAFEEIDEFYDSFKVLSVLLSVIFMCIIAYFVRQINELRASEQAMLYPEKKESKVEVLNKNWQRVIDHIDSPNESDWKLAIIEADILLNEMLESMGYHGDTISEKLKQIEKSDFNTIDKAWEAHKVRNQIAHAGASFTLTKKEAVRVIGLYKDVFEEFFFI